MVCDPDKESGHIRRFWFTAISYKGRVLEIEGSDLVGQIRLGKVLSLPTTPILFG